MRKKILSALLIGSLLAGTMACNNADKKPEETKTKVELDPSNPVSLTIWHYYNGAQQAAFDDIVSKFNSSVGKEMGIYVEGFSQGSVSDLEKAVVDAAEGVVGAKELPNIFSTYADTAYVVSQKNQLVNLKEYFTDEEISKFVDAYIEEGYFLQNDELYLCPTAKSTEILMINTTDWEPFAKATGTTYDELSTIEGVVKVAERYYKWTDDQTPDVLDDGKAFYGRDSMSNYFIIGMRQMGEEIFKVEDGKVIVNVPKDKIRRLWDNYYVPYVKGYFAAYGKFRSDDVKTGDILCYTGSSSSAMYFPDNLVLDDENIPISFEVFPSPIMEGGEQIYVQQGAGMVVTKSTPTEEYASTVFLKWFTEVENNLRFSCSSSYMPVRKDARNMEVLEQVVTKYDIKINPKSYRCLEVVMDSDQFAKCYTTIAFKNGSAARRILDYNLSDKAKEDTEKIVEAMNTKHISREEACKEYISDAAFDSWYESFCKTLNDTIFND